MAAPLRGDEDQFNHRGLSLTRPVRSAGQDGRMATAKADIVGVTLNDLRGSPHTRRRK